MHECVFISGIVMTRRRRMSVSEEGEICKSFMTVVFFFLMNDYITMGQKSSNHDHPLIISSNFNEHTNPQEYSTTYVRVQSTLNPDNGSQRSSLLY